MNVEYYVKNDIQKVRWFTSYDMTEQDLIKQFNEWRTKGNICGERMAQNAVLIRVETKEIA